MTARAMQEATFLILTALADGSQHGYGIIIEVQEISGGRVRLRAGTLYAALDRLRADGLVGVDREEIMEGRLRRYYQLTPEGTRRLAAEAARLQANAKAPWENGRGHELAPCAFMAFFGLFTLGPLIGFGESAALYAPAHLIATTVLWLADLATMVLIFSKTASPYYQHQSARHRGNPK
jgi:DNA-binding PadR family transcriptional regulator